MSVGTARISTGAGRASVWLEDLAEPIMGGMSGSPIVNQAGEAVGVVSTTEITDTLTKHGPQPYPAEDLPAWLVRALDTCTPEHRLFGQFEAEVEALSRISPSRTLPPEQRAGIFQRFEAWRARHAALGIPFPDAALTLLNSMRERERAAGGNAP